MFISGFTNITTLQLNWSALLGIELYELWKLLTVLEKFLWALLKDCKC